MDKVIEQKHGQVGNVDFYLAVLPERTQNGEPYGINMMPCNRNEWRVCYYSCYSKTYDDRFGVIVRNTLPEALHAMYQLMLETCPAILKEPPATPETSWEEVYNKAQEHAATMGSHGIFGEVNFTDSVEATSYYQNLINYLSRHWPVSPTPMSETWEDKLNELKAEHVRMFEGCGDELKLNMQWNDGVVYGIDKALELLSAPSLHQVDRWVNCGDRLPDKDPHDENYSKRVLVYNSLTSEYHSTRWCFPLDGWVSGLGNYWQPLPAAPETDKKEAE